jgi:hypothetical protein
MRRGVCGEGEDASYRWPSSLRIPPSRWLSWPNLGFWSGALRQPGEGGIESMARCIERVISGRKPMGGDWADGLGRWTEEKRLEVLSALSPAQAELVSDVERRARAAGLRVERAGPHVLAAQDRAFGQIFDLEAIARAYESVVPVVPRHRLPAPQSAEFADFIRSLSGLPVRAGWESEEFADWQREHAHTLIAATGLALGYPIESTMTIIWPWDEMGAA